MSVDTKLALHAEITAQGEQDNETLSRDVAAAKKKNYKTTTTEWNVASETGTFQGEHWPSHLPRPPSRKKILDDDGRDMSNVPTVIVYNANTPEGSSMVRVLSEKGLRVHAVVRVFTSRNTKNLIKLKGVTVKVADLNNEMAVINAAQGCQQAFLVTKYWERFENEIEEQMAKVVLSASAQAGIQRLILSTFEDIDELKHRNRKSQLMPTRDGRIFPNFDGMDSINKLGTDLGIPITHMMTSYLDDGEQKRSLILIRGENGSIVTQSHIQESEMKKN